MDENHELVNVIDSEKGLAVRSDTHFVADIIAHAHPRRGANHHDAAIMFSSQCAIGDVLSTSQILDWGVANGFIDLEGEVPSPPVLMVKDNGNRQWSRPDGGWRDAQAKVTNFINGINKAASHPRFLEEGHTPFVIKSARRSKARNMWAVRAIPQTVREFDFIEPVVSHSKTILKKYEETITGLDLDMEKQSEISRANWRIREIREFVNELDRVWKKFKGDMEYQDALIDSLAEGTRRQVEKERG